MAFKTATREKSKLRLAIDGPSGAGKTLTALRMAMELARYEGAKNHRPGRVAVIDTEAGTARKYVGDNWDGHPIQFDVDELASFSPTTYTSTIFNAARAGFDVVVVDSLSHAWNGTEGALALVDKKSANGNSYTAWKDVTPLQTAMVDAIIRCPIHVIVTMRSKMEYVLEVNERGKSVPRKVGMAPVQRAGMEYEFDIVMDLDTEHIGTMSKSRCSPIEGKSVHKPGAELMTTIIHWLETGSDIPQELLDASRLVDPVPAAAVGPKPEPTADDLAARMAAKKAALAAGQPVESPVAPPPATTVERATGPMITSDQSIEIEGLFTTLNLSLASRLKAYQKRGANHQGELTEHAADDLLTALRALVAKGPPAAEPTKADKRRAVNVAAQAPMTPAETLLHGSPAEKATEEVHQTFLAAPPVLINADQLGTIGRLFSECEISKDEQAKAMKKRGVTTINKLTAVDAAELIVKLEARQAAMVAAAAPDFPSDEVPF